MMSLLRSPSTGILALVAGLTLLTPTTRAQMPPLMPTTMPGTMRPPAAAPKIDTNRTVELKFNGAALDIVLQYYCAELTGRTLLQAPAINATITLRSQTELTVPEAVQAIKTVLAMNNIALLNQGDKFVKAVPITAAPVEGLMIQTNQTDQIAHPETDDLMSEVIPLKYVDPAEAQKAVQGLIHPYGKILVLDRINSLLVADASVNIGRIKDILTRIDQPLDIKESIHILQIRNSKASDVKTKLEEIIADQKEKEKQPTVRRLKDSGSPGVDNSSPAAIPGVIRARATAGATPATGTADTETDEGRMIRGNVKVVADDRTGSLIIITRHENMRFFEQVVAALDVATAPDVVLEVIRLEYADAEEVASMINALIGAASTPTSKSSSTTKKTTTSTSSTGTTTPGQTGTTTAAAKPEENRSFQLQEFIDQQNKMASAKGGTDGTKTKIGQLSAENIKILADKRSNALIIMASKNDMLALKDLLKSMDIMLSQVLIEAVIVQISLSKDLERGVDWVQRSMIAYNKQGGGRDPLFSFAGAGGGGSGVPLNTTSLTAPGSVANAGGLTYYLTYFGLNLDAVVKMSQTDSRTKILASPVIMTADNKEAKIDVSTEQYFYKGTSYVGYSGQYQQSVPNVESRKVGTTLTVTPRINAKRFVVMEIAQKIENVADFQSISDGSGNMNKWPIVASREMNASVSVRSGETIILGGLVDNTVSQGRTMIPWIGKIPILGIPFRSSSDKDTRSEIVVFITPYVLDSPEEIEAESIRRKAALHGADGMWEKGWSDSKLAEPPQGRASKWWRNLIK